jgi:hypothetical protein
MGLTPKIFAEELSHLSSPSCVLSRSVSQYANAKLTIVNRSEYSLTVKIMKTGGRGLYRTVYISPKSSSLVTFSSSDSFFTKTMATKGGLIPETLYRKTGVFTVQCDEDGYTEGTIEFYVSSSGGGSGQGISKAEFERNE